MAFVQLLGPIRLSQTKDSVPKAFGSWTAVRLHVNWHTPLVLFSKCCEPVLLLSSENFRSAQYFCKSDLSGYGCVCKLCE